MSTNTFRLFEHFKRREQRIKVIPGDGVTIVDVSKGFNKSAVNCLNFI